REITVSCAEGAQGNVYDGLIDFVIEQHAVKDDVRPRTQVMMNVGDPDHAFALASLPNDGIGLARLEFIINNHIGIHPMALVNYPNLERAEDVKEIARRIGEEEPREFFIRRLAEGIGRIAAAFYPKPVIVRMSDFKSNEYSSLTGGKQYEPEEENPMLGFRGASRYISDSFRECFELECRALKKVRDEMGLTNVEIMVPFVRTVREAAQVIELLKNNGLERGRNGLRVIMMCEIPSNAILADQFLLHFDGFSIGSNDMTQLTLGLDRDSGIVAGQFDERDPAVKAMLSMAILACRKAGKYVGICGQGPSDHPDLAEWLMEQGIDAISLNPDTVVETWTFLGKYAERKAAAA
ncbi:MAG: phosphoenolpyruvate synthase, partial [Prolixibacteraceae bacterium]|nr:phosphoenolpyruvate synthase [Burkholderiales bacterium]